MSDISHHSQLAGSGEVLRVRQLTEGSVHIGTRFEADEDIVMGGMHTKFMAISEVVAYDPPRLFSWISAPPRFKPRRIQWWFRLAPQNGGTRVAHAVEVDGGLLPNIFLKLPYHFLRGQRLLKGMERTLENLKRLAEGQAATGGSAGSQEERLLGESPKSKRYEVGV